ncbi:MULTISPECIES: PucR family transcriptional regulator [Prauserella salsuginis group]|uniref:PucR family transcriptional regulator n=1 Tax=Prauserella salsuginis TaxID=387889 RepID=A0ABW6G6C7_9PSEU|nr:MULTISPECIES: PucR family transcriptional regulator [Prauserella salsuginis group]
MTLVKTLLEIPSLRLRVHTGGNLLDREVSRIYVTELPDPSRYLSEGEFVLSGLLWWREPGDAEPFVHALAHAWCAGLAASGADTGGIPDDLVEACRRHRIPLLEVPADLSFAVVTERVVLALAAETGGSRKRLLSAAADDASLPALLACGAAELGADCWVVTPTGRVVAANDPRPPRRRSVLAVGGRNAVPWSLVVDADLGPGASEVAEELASLVGLARGREDEVRRTRMQVAAPLVQALADPASTTEELTRALAATGLSGEKPVRVLLARTPGSGAAAEILDELLAVLSAEDTAFTGPGAPDLVEEAWAVVPAGAGWPEDWAARATDALAALGRGRVLVGAGGLVQVPGLRGAADETRHAVQAAQRRPERVAVASGDDLGMHRLLLAGAPDELRRTLAGRVLGALPQHPELLRTVCVYLECSGSPAKAAKQLHVHVNTLRYRIARAGEILDADLTDFRTQVEVFLALSVES